MSQIRASRRLAVADVRYRLACEAVRRGGIEEARARRCRLRKLTHLSRDRGPKLARDRLPRLRSRRFAYPGKCPGPMAANPSASRMGFGTCSLPITGDDAGSITTRGSSQHRPTWNFEVR